MADLINITVTVGDYFLDATLCDGGEEVCTEIWAACRPGCYPDEDGHCGRHGLGPCPYRDETREAELLNEYDDRLIAAVKSVAEIMGIPAKGNSHWEGDDDE